MTNAKYFSISISPKTESRWMIIYSHLENLVLERLKLGVWPGKEPGGKLETRKFWIIMVNILLLGATGYTGGEVLYALAQSGFTDLRIVGLVRGDNKSKQVKAAYSDVEIVHGELKDVDLIEKLSQKSDIVLNFASAGNVVSGHAIAKGLQSRYNDLKKPGYWIQISGASLYAYKDVASSKYGAASETVYDDIDHQDQILSIMRKNPDRPLESIVLAQEPAAVKTACIVSPLIYGVGKGPVSQRSVQPPEYARATLKLGHGFMINDGENSWSNIHVRDIASLATLLVSAAIDGKEGLWNENGIYNVENGEMRFKDLAIHISNEAQKQGFIGGGRTLEIMDPEKASSLSEHQVSASALWGTNVRLKASRARQQLGWNPLGHSLLDEIPEIVRTEAGALKDTV